MTPDEWAAWQAHNAGLAKVNRSETPCSDCTVRFAVLMRLEGRCDGWPVADDGGRPWSRSPGERQALRRAQWRASKQRRREAARA